MSNMLACVNAGKVSKTGLSRRGSAMHHVQACLSARKDKQAVFTTMEALWSSCNPVYVRERPDKAVLTPE